MSPYQDLSKVGHPAVVLSAMSIQQYAVDLEAKHPRDVAHLPIDLPSYLTSSNKWPDTPAPGTVMAMWLGDDNYAIPNFDSQSHLYFSGESHPAALAPAEHPDDVANRLLYSGRQPDDEVDDDREARKGRLAHRIERGRSAGRARRPGQSHDGCHRVASTNCPARSAPPSALQAIRRAPSRLLAQAARLCAWHRGIEKIPLFV